MTAIAERLAAETLAQIERDALPLVAFYARHPAADRGMTMYGIPLIAPEKILLLVAEVRRLHDVAEWREGLAPDHVRQGVRLGLEQAMKQGHVSLQTDEDMLATVALISAVLYSAWGI